jgi:calcineurin-like phosphoesterase family protein
MQFNLDKLFFTSDTHFGHTNSIKYDSRPFKDVPEMDAAMISNWNKVVPTDGVVFHLGDVGFRSPEDLRNILDQLNGKIYLIKGNHDKSAVKYPCKDRFEIIVDYYELMVKEPYGEKHLLCMMHYPMACWNQSHYGLSWNLHGHSHGRFPAKGKQYDVGVNGNNFTPISYKELKIIMNEKKPYDQVTQAIIDEDDVGDVRRTRVIDRHDLKTCPTCDSIIKEEPDKECPDCNNKSKDKYCVLCDKNV